jgi:hypothetical protein
MRLQKLVRGFDSRRLHFFKPSGDEPEGFLLGAAF